MVLALIEVGRFSCCGERDNNLDRIISGRDFYFIVDGYSCSEEHLDQALNGLTISPQNMLFLQTTQAHVKMCISGFCILDNFINFYHKGDCRIYLQGSGLISCDNTLAWDRLSAGNNRTPTTVANLVKKHPLRNVLSDHLASERYVLPFLTAPRGVGNVMLCTDGFWNNFSEEFLLDLLDNPSGVSKASELSNFTDNAACIIVNC